MTVVHRREWLLVRLDGYNKSVLVDQRALEGHTVHVVPGEGGKWHVSDTRGLVSPWPSKTTATEWAKQVAAAHPPSQVVVLDQFGRLIPIARYHLPQYYRSRAEQGNSGSVFEAAVKSLIIGAFTAAGVAVLSGLVDRVQRELKAESAKSSHSTRRKGRRSA